MFHGTVVSLHRWPVKSMGGEDVDALVIDVRGAAGDRTHALFDTHQDQTRRLTARQSSRMLLWTARYPDDVAADALDPDDPPLPIVTAPECAGEWRWDDPALAQALSDDLGRAITLRREPYGQQDLGETVLLTTTATHAAVEGELGPLDQRRWRTNVHVELDAPAYAEERWEHGEMTIGGVPFAFLHPCVRCVIPTRDPDTAVKRPEILRWITREHAGLFGMNARPTGAGIIRVGDAVTVTPPA